MKTKRVCSIVLMLLVSSMSTKAWAGFDYKLKYDRFTGNKTSTYDLSVGNECRLTATSAGKLDYCVFQNSSNNADDPNLILITTSKEWDIMQYRSTSPYREGKIPSIITYKDGKKLNTTLDVKYTGDPIRGNGVMEVVLVQLGLIKKTIPEISQIEVKYGTNEYLIVLDPILTKRALEFQE